MKIAIAKPEWGFRGGFEFVLDRIVDHLVTSGHTIEWLTVDAHAAGQPPIRSFGLEVPEDVWACAYEYFRYLAILDRFQALDAGDADVLVCTQPGSWAVEHPRKLALFYHHLRVFYDLRQPYLDAGFVPPTFHDDCATEIRSIDEPLLDGVTHFLAPSAEVEGRLRRFNGVGAERSSQFLAGFAFQDGRGTTESTVPAGGGHVLVVSRHEWPKRIELAVAAAHHLRVHGDPIDVRIVGGGGRLDHARALDARFSALGDPDALGAEDGSRLWLPAATNTPPDGYVPSANLEMLGHVDASVLDRLYADALCIVAPAYLEDYGLTAIEAMAYGKPVVCCRDGGGLTETVQDGVNGLIVEPTGAAIAAAVQRLRAEPGLAAGLAEGAKATAATYTWARAMSQLTEGLDRVAA